MSIFAKADDRFSNIGWINLEESDAYVQYVSFNEQTNEHRVLCLYFIDSLPFCSCYHKDDQHRHIADVLTPIEMELITKKFKEKGWM